MDVGETIFAVEQVIVYLYVAFSVNKEWRMFYDRSGYSCCMGCHLNVVDF